MKQRWTVRAYQNEDEVKIVRLAGVVFRTRKDVYDLDYWKWKYGNNAGQLICVAEQKQKIVGHMALLPTSMQVGKNVIRGSQAVDLMVHRDFRRQGMFLELGRNLSRVASREGVLVIYGIPTEPAYRGHLQYGWFHIGKITVYVRFFNIENILRVVFDEGRELDRVLRRLSKPIEFLFPFLSSIVSSRDETKEDFRIVEVGRLDDHITELWEKVSHDHDIILVRDKRYLNWRYAEKPDSDYRIYVAYRDGVIAGYLVLTSKEYFFIKKGYIVDILADSPEAFRCLIGKAIEYFTEENVDVGICWLMGDASQAGCLREASFFAFPKKVRLIARLSSRKLSEAYLRRKGRWYFTMGDSDLV